jgi:hypothetical protein
MHVDLGALLGNQEVEHRPALLKPQARHERLQRVPSPGRIDLSGGLYGSSIASARMWSGAWSSRRVNVAARQ